MEPASLADPQAWAVQVLAVLESLAPEYRAVLRALYFENQTVRSLAAALRVPELLVARRAAAGMQLFAAASAIA